MLVHVHAFETAPGGDAGSGGFDWFRTTAEADAAYAAAERGPENANFRFDVEVSETDPEEITAEIDAQLSELTAASTVRTVGTDVLRYWQENGFDMGDAENPAQASPSP